MTRINSRARGSHQYRSLRHHESPRCWRKLNRKRHRDGDRRATDARRREPPSTHSGLGSVVQHRDGSHDARLPHDAVAIDHRLQDDDASNTKAGRALRVLRRDVIKAVRRHIRGVREFAVSQRDLALARTLGCVSWGAGRRGFRRRGAPWSLAPLQAPIASRTPTMKIELEVPHAYSDTGNRRMPQ